MDRRNGGDPLAPPRPPKSLPRVHRPRAPEPDIVDSPSIHVISSNLHPPPIPSHHNQQQQHQHHRPISRMSNHSSSSSNSSNSSSSSSDTAAAAAAATASSSSQQPQQQQHHRSVPPIPPATAPLTPLQSNNRSTNNYNSNTTTSSSSSSAISTFSRRRTEMPTPQQQHQARISPITVIPAAVQRSLTPVIAPATNFISNAIGSIGRSPSPINNSVTLQIPRPENERLPNEYVDTPFANLNNSKLLVTPGSRHSLATSTVPNHRNQLNLNHSQATTNISTIDGISVLNHHQHNSNSSSNNKILPNRTATTTNQRPTTLLPITKQPSFRSSTLSKKDAAALHQQFSHCPEDSILSSSNASNMNGFVISSASDQLNSITCPQCNRCRCEECQRPRQLPSKWLCDDNCFCSAETIIDYASCLCCVKALYYHCSKDQELDCDSETIRCAENPCSCVPYKRASRWGCLGALSLVLPCLLCYWPMRGCVSLCAKCYAKHSRHGCRCNNNNTAPTSTNNSFNSRLNIINLATPTSQDQPHHHTHRARSNNNNNGSDLTPEKRLLDSSCEY